MKHIEQVRGRVTRQIVQLKAWISSIDGDKEMLARLSGKDGEERMRRIIEFTMKELGVVTETNKPARQAMRKVLGG